MKTSPSTPLQKFSIPSPRSLYLQGVALLAAAGFAQAAFVTGFETSSGYTSGSTIFGVHDTAAPGSNAWAMMFGDSAKVVASGVNPQTGALALRLTNNASGTAVGTSLLLGSSVDVANPFTISFGLSIDSVTNGTQMQAQIAFGANSVNYNTDPNWFRLTYNDGNLELLLSTPSGLSTNPLVLGAYTDYSNLGQYITFSFGIDPTTYKFTSFLITGANASADKISAILAAPSGGTIPHLNGIPATYFSVVSGGNDTITFNVDNIQIVPEPASAMLSLLGALATCGSRRFRRRG